MARNPGFVLTHGAWRRNLTAVSAALLLCTIVQPVFGQKENADVVITSFDWPVGLQAQVMHQRIQIRESGDERDSTANGVKYRMLVERHPAGRLISYDEFSVDGAQSMTDQAALIDRLGAISPRLVVSDYGELVDVKDLDQVSQAARTLLQPMLDSMPAEAAGITAMLDQMLSKEFLMSKAAEEWGSLVGVWLETEFELGAVYELAVDESIPLFPDRIVPFLYQFRLSKWTECRRGEALAKCVVLEMTSFPDPETMTALLDEMVGDAVTELVPGGVRYRDWKIENHVRLVAEPSGLIPHHLQVTQAVTGSVDAGREGVASFAQIRTRTWDYRYAPFR